MGGTLIHLRRITDSKTFIPQIDGLRFVAILSVVLFHIHGHLVFSAVVVTPLTRNGEILDILAKRGVELFFVISGFILATPFAATHLLDGPRVNLRSYYLRRLTRLEPPYIVNLLCWYAVRVFYFHSSAAALLPNFIASTLYVHQIIYRVPSLLSGILWSLEVEIQFYILAPLLALLLTLREVRWRRTCLVVLIVGAGWASVPLIYTPAQLSLLYYVNFFLAGILLCDLYTTRGTSWHSTNHQWDLVALCGWPLVWAPLPSVSHVLSPLLIVVLYIAAFRGTVCKRLFANPVLATIGGMCYTIYLYHWLTMSLVARYTQHFHVGGNFIAYFALQSLLILPVILAVSTVFFVLIERPCMDKRWPWKLAAASASTWRGIGLSKR